MAKKKKAKRKAKKKTTKRTAKKKTKKKAAKKKTKKKAAKKKTKKKAAKKKTKKKAAKKKTKKKAAKKKSKRKPSAAFMAPVQPDEALAAVVGSKGLPRTQLTKKLWIYIKKHNLQDPENRRMINADDNLRKVFNGKRQVNMFEMTKLVNMHVS